MYENAFTPLEPLDELDATELAPPDLDEILHQLDAAEPFQRMQAARVLCDIEDPRAIPRLVELLRDECTLIRVSAAYALGRNSDERVVEPLIAALDADWNGYVRKGIVWALGNARDRRALPVLIRALETDITAVRLWAASALGQIVDIDGVKPLLTALQSDSIAAVRSNSAWSLGRLVPKLALATGYDDWPVLYEQVIEGLISSLQADGDSGVSDDVRDTLSKLGDERGLEAIADWEAGGLPLDDL